MNPNQPPEQPPEPLPSPEKVGELLTSSETIKAASDDEFKPFLDHAPIAIIICRALNDEPRIVYANHSFETMVGLPMAELEGKSWSVLDAFTHEDDANLTLTQAIAAGEDFLGTFRKELGEGRLLLAQAYASIIEGEGGAGDYRIAALVDVTDRERFQREAFEQEIRDKDLLLKELQHRVKNNLQLITALIRLEARAVQRGDEVDLDRLAGRIDSLALLYQSMSLDHWGPEIDLGAYLGGIATAAVRCHAVEGIQLDLKVDYCVVSVNVAMPVGLLINELLTNAFKHAFAGRETGTLSLACHCRDDRHCRVVVADNGVGFPRGMTWPTPGKLGALILQTLRENTTKTDFRLESSPGEGARVTIEFNHQPPSRQTN